MNDTEIGCLREARRELQEERGRIDYALTALDRLLDSYGGAEPARLRHGLLSTYRHAGCRCDECTEANTAACRKWRQRRTGGIPHGSGGYSNYGCRCEICTPAGRERLAARARANGRGQDSRKPWTDAEKSFITERDGRRYVRTALECARALGRSVAAVDAQRHLRT